MATYKITPSGLVNVETGQPARKADVNRTGSFVEFGPGVTYNPITGEIKRPVEIIEAQQTTVPTQPANVLPKGAVLEPKKQLSLNADINKRMQEGNVPQYIRLQTKPGTETLNQNLSGRVQQIKTGTVIPQPVKSPLREIIIPAFSSGVAESKKAFESPLFDVPEPVKQVVPIAKPFEYFARTAGQGAAFVGETGTELAGLTTKNFYIESFKTPPVKLVSLASTVKTYPTQQGANIAYQGGRIVVQVLPYFVSPEVALGKSIIDISAAKSKREFAGNVVFGLATAGTLRGLGKVSQATALGINKLEGGTLKVLKKGPTVYSGTIAQGFSNVTQVGEKYIVPGIMGGLVVASVPPILESAKLGDFESAKASERELIGGLSGVTIGGVAGSFIGTEVGKTLQPFIFKETISQSTNFTKAQKDLGLKAIERAYGSKAIPKNLTQYLKGYKVGEFKVGSLSILNEGKYFTTTEGRKIAGATESALKTFKGDVKIIGSSTVPPQIAGNKPYKFFGDIDVAKGSVQLGGSIAKNINELGLKDVKAIVRTKDTKVFGEKVFVELQRGGKRIGFEPGGERPEFVNITQSLKATKRQYNIFGDPFGRVGSAFVPTSGGESNIQVFNVRDQLRAKVQGAFFSGRAKDVVDIEAILKGTDVYAKQFQKVKESNIWLDERAVFKPGKKDVVDIEARLPGKVFENNYYDLKSGTRGTFVAPVSDYYSVPETKQGVYAGSAPSYTGSAGLYSVPTTSQDYGVKPTPYEAPPSNYIKPGVYEPPTGNIIYDTPVPPPYTPPPTKRYNVFYKPPTIPKEPVKYTPPYTPTYFPPYTPPPTKTFFRGQVFDKKQKKKLFQAFDVFTKKGKKEVLLAKGLPKNLAFKKGKAEVFESARRTFYLKQSGLTTTPDVKGFNLFGLRKPTSTSKLNRLGERVFVQQTKYAISSPQEKREIPGRAAELRRKVFWRNYI